MPLYKNKYRTQTTRLAGYDYASQGYYYITICTQNREHFFGHVDGGEMWLTALGNEARKCWQAIPEHFPFVELDAFVIMPDHVHGVIYIGREGDRFDVEAQDLAPPHITSKPHDPSTPHGNKFGPQSKNLASIIRGFKIGVTKYARKHDIPFAWQSRYYDHIVRNEDDLDRIRCYIQNNPTHWKEDEEYSYEDMP